jgi:hypothetical protein
MSKWDCYPDQILRSPLYLNTDALRLVERSEKLCKNVRQWSADVPGFVYHQSA